jgi:hypothetical protein
VGADFTRLKNWMAVSSFGMKYNGPMTFYDAEENIYWKNTYTRSSWANGWNAAKKKVNEAAAVAMAVTEAPAAAAAAATDSDRKSCCS